MASQPVTASMTDPSIRHASTPHSLKKSYMYWGLRACTHTYTGHMDSYMYWGLRACTHTYTGHMDSYMYWGLRACVM